MRGRWARFSRSTAIVVLTLRHFEQLTRAETARVLGIEESAAGKRYVRALKRLKEILASFPGGIEGL